MIKNLPAKQETQIQSRGQEDTLKKGMATYSSILAWRIPWTEEPKRLTVHGVTKSQTRLWQLSRHARILPQPSTFSNFKPKPVSGDGKPRNTALIVVWI